METVVLSKRTRQLEQLIVEQPDNYDHWFDLIQLQEQSEASTLEAIRDTYERAIARIPSSSVKQDWKRYVYLWLKYAQFEETKGQDQDKTRQIYTKALQIFGR